MESIGTPTLGVEAWLTL